MRSARLCASLGIAAVLLAPATALADPAPLPKPATVSPLPKPTTQTPVTAQQPVTQTPVTQTPVTQTRVTPRHTVTTTITQTPVVPLITSGGREQPVLLPTTLNGGRKDAPPTPTTAKQTATVKQTATTAELFPTRLSSVGDEALPSYDAWPSWVLGAFTLLASAEAFLLVRLARNRRFAQGDALRPY